MLPNDPADLGRPREGESMMSAEPVYDIAHLGHVELFTPVMDESYRFFMISWAWRR
ncbi:hypothetical protein TC41_1511 [Alicyclobacillus acidocaldarius subsp. acidocaldarius Tc-4-1]|uniref:Uncharacterized protein n=1 Tax=Alicyclobacillus acidocaldarius (strain Tc-4-1) TaxID=1048834 RepID=F8IJC3_ALIAT|nr:hypothetical protein TC41_1511 [Alicyclobacillus acidocaldarius subsp. acidocaldarius Tc-4-1]